MSRIGVDEEITIHSRSALDAALTVNEKKGSGILIFFRKIATRVFYLRLELQGAKKNQLQKVINGHSGTLFSLYNT